MVQEKYPEAIHHDSIALHGFADVGDSLGYAMVLGNLANIYSETEDFDKSMEYFRQAVDIYKRTNEPLGMGRTLVNLSALYIDQGLYLQALKAAQDGLEICSDHNIGLCVQYCLSNIGTAYLESYIHRDTGDQKLVLIPGHPDDLLDHAINNLSRLLYSLKDLSHRKHLKKHIAPLPLPTNTRVILRMR